jgi:hypothetical protein
MIADFRRRFWVSLALTLPILLLSPMFQRFLGFEETLAFPGDVYVLFGLASVVYFWGGWPFLKGIARELAARRPGMMTLIALAISVAYFYSSATVFGLAGEPFFWGASGSIRPHPRFTFSIHRAAKIGGGVAPVQGGDGPLVVRGRPYRLQIGEHVEQRVTVGVPLDETHPPGLDLLLPCQPRRRASCAMLRRDLGCDAGAR